jgi:hypothetical protein
MAGDVFTAAQARYRAAILHRRSVLGFAEYELQDGTKVKNLLIALPLSSDGQVVDRIFGAFSPRSEWLARQALRNLNTLAHYKTVRTHVVL